MKKILISTGGSGGHVIPAINLYNHLKNNFHVSIYTDKRGSKYFPKQIDRTIFEVNQFSEKKYLLPLKIISYFYAFIKSLLSLNGKKFDILISTGGYMSFPVVLAAKIYNKKIFLFEPNSIIGRSNKYLLRFSNKILCYDKNLQGINKTYNNKIIEIPPILNKCFYEKKINKENDDILKILIIGGSQSSLFFTKKLKHEIIQLADKYKISVYQQLSKGFDIGNYKKDYDKNNITNNLFYFEHDYLCNRNQFDIAISRSGASSLAELSQMTIPFIAVPFPFATDNHQFLNAKRYYDLNCCWILEEKNFNSGDISKKIIDIMSNKTEYLEKKNNLKKINENINWENISKKIIKYLNEN